MPRDALAAVHTEICPSCQVEFDRPAVEAEYYRERALVPPATCRPCRARQRAERNAALGSSSDGANPSTATAARGLQHGRNSGRRGDRGTKTMFAATCVACGAQTSVPFQPRRNRPVFCRDCFAKR